MARMAKLDPEILAHLEWIGKQDFALPADQIVLRDYLHEVERLKVRVESLEKSIAELTRTVRRPRWCGRSRRCAA